MLSSSIRAYRLLFVLYISYHILFLLFLENQSSPLTSTQRGAGSLNDLTGKIELIDDNIIFNEEFKKNVAIPYFKDIYKDLAAQSDAKSKGINKVSILNVSQRSRRRYLPRFSKSIHNQTWQDPLPWQLVFDRSSDMQDGVIPHLMTNKHTESN